MKLEDQVCSLKYASKLHEYGVPQNSLFYYYQEIVPSNPNMYYYGYKQDDMPFRLSFSPKSKLSTSNIHSEYSAFTVSEICEMLPDLIISNNIQYELVIVKESEDAWLCQYSRNNNLLDSLHHIDRVYRKTMAETVAYMLIHLLELGKVTAEECNKRKKISMKPI